MNAAARALGGGGGRPIWGFCRATDAGPLGWASVADLGLVAVTVSLAAEMSRFGFARLGSRQTKNSPRPHRYGPLMHKAWVALTAVIPALAAAAVSATATISPAAGA